MGAARRRSAFKVVQTLTGQGGGSLYNLDKGYKVLPIGQWAGLPDDGGAKRVV